MSTCLETREFAPIATNSGGWVIGREQNDAGAVTVRQGMLDKLLRDGLALPPPMSSRDGLIVMLRGKAGTGKSTLALQLAANLMRPRCSPPPKRPPEREFFSLEQDGAELKAIYRRMVTQQCRAKRQFLLAVFEPPQPVDTVAGEYLDLLGATHRPPALLAQARRMLEGNSDAASETWLEEAGLPEATRIRFNSDESSNSRHSLKEGPLARALQFVAKFKPNDDRYARPTLFIDGLSILSEHNRERLEMAELIESLRKRCLIGVIAYEPSRGIEDSLDHQVDMVIELEEKHLNDPIDYVVHELHFKKSRYQEAALGWHQYKIRGYGLEIYPSVHFQVHSHLYMNRQLVRSLTPVNQPSDDDEDGGSRTGKPAVEAGWSIIEQVLGGIKPGDSVALLGPRGAFKTTLTLDFLFRSHTTPCDPDPAKAQRGSFDRAEHGLLVSVIDNEDTLRVHQTCPMVGQCASSTDGCLDECCKHVFLFYQRPGCISSSEFLYYLKTRLQVAKKPLGRLAFWDLTQLEHRFPLLANDPMFVPALLDLFKMRETEEQPGSMVKSVFMGAANARLSTTIAAVADNVLFCWRDRVKPEWRQGSDVTKATARIWGGCERGNDYLMIYVDRTSGAFGKEQKNLYAFPILGGVQLVVPAGNWNTANYAIPSELIAAFEQSEGQILHVTEMQGFASEAPRTAGAASAGGPSPAACSAGREAIRPEEADGVRKDELKV